MFITLEHAIEIVIGLVRENIFEERQCDDDEMAADREKQIAAIDTLEDYFVNHVFGGEE
jgi:hypothetical protein